MKLESSSQEVLDRILVGARWSTILRLLTQVVSWLATIVVVRFISPEDYGLNAMLEAPWGFLLLFSTLGIDLALTRAADVSERQLSAAFGWLLLINFGIFLLYFFGAPFIANYFNDDRLELMSKVLSLTFLILPFRIVPNSMLSRDLQFKLISFVELVGGVSAAFFTLALAVAGQGVWALIFGVLINRGVVTVLMAVMRPWYCRPTFKFKDVKGVLVFGGVATFWGALTLLFERLPSAIAGPNLPPSVLGLFAVAIQFSTLPISKIMPIVNPIIFPAFSRFKDDRVRAVAYFASMMRLLLLLFIPVVFGLAAVANAFVPIVLGPKWLDLIVPLMLLSAVMPLRFFTYVCRPVANALDCIYLPVKSTVFAIIFLATLLFLYGRLGLSELVLSVVLSDLVVATHLLLLFRSSFGYGFGSAWKAFFPGLLCGAVMVAVVVPLGLALDFLPLIACLVVQIVAGAAVYIFLLRVVFPEDFAGLLRLVVGRRRSE